MTRVHVINSTEKKYEGGFSLALEYCLYQYDKEAGGGSDLGFRFIWKKPEGQRLAHRGQARIPSKKDSDSLWKQATKEGWASK